MPATARPPQAVRAPLLTTLHRDLIGPLLHEADLAAERLPGHPARWPSHRQVFVLGRGTSNRGHGGVSIRDRRRTPLVAARLLCPDCA